jgi:hypothetical protein
MATNSVWPVNEQDEIVLVVGNGTQNKAGYVSQDFVSTNQDATAVPVTIRGMSSPFSFTTRELTSKDDGDVLVCNSQQTATINSGMYSGFGCAFRGEVVFAAGSGVTLTDLRAAGATTPWCAVINTGNNTYDIVGSKV